MDGFWDFDDATREALGAFLAKRNIMRPNITTRPIGDGRSNLTFMVDDGERKVVLRRPPAPPTPPRAHDMLREAKILASLEGSDVPVAQVLATSEAGEVLDVDFYIMDFVSGPVVTERTPDPLATPARRREVGFSLIDTLVSMHAVDWRAAGLADLGRPEGFNERHIGSLSRLVALDDGSLPRNYETIQPWLVKNAPPESRASIVHGDYRIGNVIIAPDAPGRVAAVLDWELATLGDPMIDVGYLLASVPEAGAGRTPTEEFALAMLEEGYPTREELAERYAQRSGYSLDNLAWYTTMALWRVSTLYEYGRRRAVRGVGDPYYGDQRHVQSFLAAAHRAAGLEQPPPFDPKDDDRVPSKKAKTS